MGLNRGPLGAPRASWGCQGRGLVGSTQGAAAGTCLPCSGQTLGGQGGTVGVRFVSMPNPLVPCSKQAGKFSIRSFGLKVLLCNMEARYFGFYVRSGKSFSNKRQTNPTT